MYFIFYRQANYLWVIESRIFISSCNALMDFSELHFFLLFVYHLFALRGMVSSIPI